ncbi:MAG: hypothetical protein H6867_09410 [Rhodospirillales bacterium]|nr:hypothetical protein [Rhodospirillales bacterium]
MLLFCTPAAIVLVFDPFFVYHKPLFIKDLGFDGTDRYQNAGLINSWLADPDEPFDTVIIGTSMTQNFPVTAIRNEDGIHALKLTLAGAPPKSNPPCFTRR